MKLPWTKNKAPEKVTMAAIAIYTKSRNYGYSTPLKNNSLTFYYRDFVKWFHSRPQSDCYSFRYNEGIATILRKEITGYTISKEEH